MKITVTLQTTNLSAILRREISNNTDSIEVLSELAKDENSSVSFSV